MYFSHLEAVASITLNMNTNSSLAITESRINQAKTLRQLHGMTRTLYGAGHPFFPIFLSRFIRVSRMYCLLHKHILHIPQAKFFPVDPACFSNKDFVANFCKEVVCYISLFTLATHATMVSVQVDHYEAAS